MTTERAKLEHRIDAIDPGSLARATTIRLRRGTIETPIFMPVGTLGTVKGLAPFELRDAGAALILANTYHLFLRPSTAVLERAGGLHRFMAWDRPILTDSGGYQFFSLSSLCRYDDRGVEFKSHLDGTKHFFTPERVIELQASIDSDIHMQLDQCPALPAAPEVLREAMLRSIDWARRSRAVSVDRQGALFAIVQGGTDRAMRRFHAETVAAEDYAGYALGGLAVGEAPDEMYEVIEATTPFLPADRPRYLMGVGTPRDLLEAIGRGIDMFDCVLPTRNARNGQVFTRAGRRNLRNARFQSDDAPLDAACGCYTCRTFSRAYLAHLFRSQEMLGPRLATLHNIQYYLDLVRGARDAILAGAFDSYRSRCIEAWSRRDD
jgi:queuine tRNA-ribosyltransferase